MQGSRLARALVCAAGLLIAAPAFAFGGGHGGGGHGGGFGGGGFHGGGFAGGPHGGYAGGGWHGGGWRGGGGWGYPVYGWGYAYPYDYGYDYPDDDWDYGYDYPGYDYSYDNGYNSGYGPGVYSQGGYGQNPGAYPPGPQASGQLGQYCRTPVKTCQLYQASAVSAGCSCRNGATRAYGRVVP
ncbi:MAG: hypothetical protein ACLQL2_00855 [Methylovirgula sp.]